ncbi:MAG: DUF4215 domain-containing protein [Candidatus Micrarchaeota archaeon]
MNVLFLVLFLSPFVLAWTPSVQNFYSFPYAPTNEQRPIMYSITYSDLSGYGPSHKHNAIICDNNVLLPDLLLGGRCASGHDVCDTGGFKSWGASLTCDGSWDTSWVPGTILPRYAFVCDEDMQCSSSKYFGLKVGEHFHISSVDFGTVYPDVPATFNFNWQKLGYGEGSTSWVRVCPSPSLTMDAMCASGEQLCLTSSSTNGQASCPITFYSPGNYYLHAFAVDDPSGTNARVNVSYAYSFNVNVIEEPPLNQPPFISNAYADPNPVTPFQVMNFVVDWSDPNNDKVFVRVCSTSNVGLMECADETICSKSNQDNSPTICTASAPGTPDGYTYYAVVCDLDIECSNVRAIPFTVQNEPVPSLAQQMLDQMNLIWADHYYGEYYPYDNNCPGPDETISNLNDVPETGLWMQSYPVLSAFNHGEYFAVFDANEWYANNSLEFEIGYGDDLYKLIANNSDVKKIIEAGEVKFTGFTTYNQKPGMYNSTEARSSIITKSKLEGGSFSLSSEAEQYYRFTEEEKQLIREGAMQVNLDFGAPLSKYIKNLQVFNRTINLTASIPGIAENINFGLVTLNLTVDGDLSAGAGVGLVNEFPYTKGVIAAVNLDLSIDGDVDIELLEHIDGHADVNFVDSPRRFILETMRPGLAYSSDDQCLDSIYLPRVHYCALTGDHSPKDALFPRTAVNLSSLDLILGGEFFVNFSFFNNTYPFQMIVPVYGGTPEPILFGPVDIKIYSPVSGVVYDAYGNLIGDTEDPDDFGGDSAPPGFAPPGGSPPGGNPPSSPIPLFYDDFSDLDYTNNPTWTVTTGHYLAVNGYLETNDGGGASIAHASLNLQDQTELFLDYKVYLGQLLPGASLAIGSAGSIEDSSFDGYSIYLNKPTFKLVRYDNGVPTNLILDTSGFLENRWYDIAVTRDANGKWEIKIDGSPRGTAVDNTYDDFPFVTAYAAHHYDVGTGFDAIAIYDHTPNPPAISHKRIVVPAEVPRFALALEGEAEGTYDLEVLRPMAIKDAVGDTMAFTLMLNFTNRYTELGLMDYFDFDYNAFGKEIQERVDLQGAVGAEVVAVAEEFAGDEENLMPFVDRVTILEHPDQVVAPNEDVDFSVALVSLGDKLVGKEVDYYVNDVFQSTELTDDEGKVHLTLNVPDSEEDQIVRLNYDSPGYLYESTEKEIVFEVENAAPEFANVAPLGFTNVSGVVEINAEVIDTNLDSVEVWLGIVEGDTADKQLVANELPFNWDSTQYADGVYAVEIRARDTLSVENVQGLLVNVENGNTIVLPPELLAPDNGVGISFGPLFFDWTDVAGAEYYTIKAVFPDSSVQKFNFIQSQLLLPVGFIEKRPDGEFQWSISATVGGQETEYSEVRTFTKDTVVTNLLPPYGTVVNEAPFELSWDAVQGAAKYRLYVDGPLKVNVLLPQNYVVVQPNIWAMFPDGEYYWKVAAVSPTSFEAEFSEENMFVKDTSAPEPFCGDGFLDLGEECDDGNNQDGDGCSSVCTIEYPEPVWETVLYDDFTDLDYANNPTWTVTSGSYTAQESFLRTTYAQASSEAYTAMSAADKDAVSIKARYKLDSVNPGVGLAIGSSQALYDGVFNGYMLYLNPQQFSLTKFENGEPSALITSVESHANSQWYDVEAVRGLTGEWVIKLNGVEKGTAVDSSFNDFQYATTYVAHTGSGMDDIAVKVS